MKSQNKALLGGIIVVLAFFSGVAYRHFHKPVIQVGLPDAVAKPNLPLDLSPIKQDDSTKNVSITVSTLDTKSPTIQITPIEPTSVEWKQYTNDKYGFQMSYFSNLAVLSSESVYPYGKEGVAFKFPESYLLSGSTISLASSAISTSVSSDSANQCYYIGGQKPLLYGVLQIPAKVAFGSNMYEWVKSGDCSAGTCIATYQYSIHKNGLCFRNDMAVFSSNANMTNGATTTPANDETVKHFLSDFDEIVSTLRFTK